MLLGRLIEGGLGGGLVRQDRQLVVHQAGHLESQDLHLSSEGGYNNQQARTSTRIRCKRSGPQRWTVCCTVPISTVVIQAATPYLVFEMPLPHQEPVSLPSLRPRQQRRVIVIAVPPP